MIWSNGNIRVSIMDSAEIVMAVSEQLVSEMELMHSCGAKTKSGDKAILGSKEDDNLGITWVVVTKLSGIVMISPVRISLSLSRRKWSLERSKSGSRCRAPL